MSKITQITHDGAFLLLHSDAFGVFFLSAEDITQARVNYLSIVVLDCELDFYAHIVLVYACQENV